MQKSSGPFNKRAVDELEGKALSPTASTRSPRRHETLSSLLLDIGQLHQVRILEEKNEQTLQPSQAEGSPKPQQVLEALLELGANLEPEASEEEVVLHYLDTFKKLFPGRRIAARLCGAESLTLVYATDPLLPQAKSTIHITASIAHMYDLSQLDLPHCLKISSEYQAVFAEGASGFDLPLVAQDSIIGSLTIEYSQGQQGVSDDQPLMHKLARQLANDLLKTRLLRESLYLRDYLAKLLEHANAPIIVIGKHREMRVINRAFVALSGHDRDELLGSDFATLLPESERTRLLPVFINALRGVPTTGFELKLTKKSGNFARISLNVASVLNPRGEVEGLICIGRDLTELRQLEEQVIQAEKLATLGQLAAGVVHELNNPLTSISIYSEYLLKKALTQHQDAKDIERLKRITSSADRILRFTRDLVTYARPSTADPSLVSIHEILDQAIVFCEHPLAEHDVQIERQYTEGSPLIFAIPSQLHQVMINLITNACHAMPPQGARLTFETCLTYDGNICIRLKDNGTGISPSVLPRVFEPFFTTKGEGKGTGLGLSIARNIIEQHNGTITVQALQEGGTVFEIVLPARERQSDFAL